MGTGTVNDIRARISSAEGGIRGGCVRASGTGGAGRAVGASGTLFHCIKSQDPKN